MEKVYAIDFETYYDDECSVKTLGPEAYVRHPKFSAYLVSVYGETYQYVGPIAECNWESLSEATRIVAHNARFDRAVYGWCVGKGLAAAIGAQWSCTADLAAYLQAGRSLKDAAKDLLGVTDVDKKVRDKMAKMSYQDAIAAGMQEALHAYALKDAELCYRLWTQFSDQWPAHERRWSQMNMDAGAEGIYVDSGMLGLAIGKLNLEKWTAEKSIPWDWSDRKTPLSPTKIGLACRALGIEAPKSLAEDSPECEAWEAQYAEKYPWINAIRTWRKTNMYLQKLKTMERRLASHGSMSYETKYFGATTGRFSGSGGFNIQNLPKEPFNGVDIRKMIVPRPGHVFINPDLSQIEARILLWYAKDTEVLKQIEEGMSVYEAHARETMGWKGGKLKDENKDLYALAKARVLGCGYGCGGPKFQTVARVLAGVELDLDTAKSTVQAYRDTNHRIVSLWQRLQRDFFWAFQLGEPFELELASGRVIKYMNIRSVEGEMKAQTEINGNHVNFYGGKLVENLVQATARDVFMVGWDRLREAGFRVVFHVHDEYVIEVPKAVGSYEPAVKEIRKAITDPIPWLPGCPLEAEIKVCDRYEK